MAKATVGSQSHRKSLTGVLKPIIAVLTATKSRFESRTHGVYYGNNVCYSTISGSHVFDNMADEGSDASAAVLDLLKSLNDNINELKGESKQVNNRLDALERRRSPSPLSPSASIGLNQEENEQDVDNVYEHSEEEDADEDEFDFTSVLFTKKIGEKIMYGNSALITSPVQLNFTS